LNLLIPHSLRLFHSLFLVINPIVPNDIPFKDEFMTDSENDSLAEDE